MEINYLFGYRCPIWLLSPTLGSLEDLLGPICHRWLAKRWKIDQVLPILVVEWGFGTIGYAYLLHKTYFRPIHLYPTTLAVGAVPSDTTKEIILPWICWNPYSIAFKRSVLVITNSGYLQEECCGTVYLFIYSSADDPTLPTLCRLIQRCLRSPISVLELSELDNNWLQAVHFQYIIFDYHEKER